MYKRQVEGIGAVAAVEVAEFVLLAGLSRDDAEIEVFAAATLAQERISVAVKEQSSHRLAHEQRLLKERQIQVQADPLETRQRPGNTWTQNKRINYKEINLKNIYFLFFLTVGVGSGGIESGDDVVEGPDGFLGQVVPDLVLLIRHREVGRVGTDLVLVVPLREHERPHSLQRKYNIYIIFIFKKLKESRAF